jgi:hypothetical protein
LGDIYFSTFKATLRRLIGPARLLLENVPLNGQRPTGRLDSANLSINTEGGLPRRLSYSFRRLALLGFGWMVSVSVCPLKFRLFQLRDRSATL